MSHPHYNEKQSKMNHVNDKFLMNECIELTKIMLEQKKAVNKIVGIVKEYTGLYLLIKSQDEELAKNFTVETWLRCQKKMRDN